MENHGHHTTAETTTATEAYDEQTTRLLANLDRLQASLSRHRRNQRDHPHDWGFVGDLTHWNELLDRITLANVEADPFAGIVDVEVNDGWDR